MKNKPIIVLDEELQIIRQKLSGPTNEEMASLIIDQTTQCASRLKDPGNVRILLDGRAMGKISSKARQKLTQMQNKLDLTKLASWGMSLMDRTVVRFINRVTGMNKLKVFKDEKTAIEWLIN